MDRYILAAAGFAIAGAIFFSTTQSASASSDKMAFCYEKKVLLAAGTGPTEFATASTIVIDKMIREKGFNDFMMIDHNGMEIICGWKG
jgi:hypothetical protein